MGGDIRATSDFWPFPSRAPTFQAGLQSARGCAQEVGAIGEKRGLGPRRVHAAMEVLRELRLPVGGATGSEMEKHRKTIFGQFITATANQRGRLMAQVIFQSPKASETYMKDEEAEGARLGILSSSLNPTPVLGAARRQKEIGETAPAWVKNFSALKLKEAMAVGPPGINAAKGRGAGPEAALERAVETALRRRRKALRRDDNPACICWWEITVGKRRYQTLRGQRGHSTKFQELFDLATQYRLRRTSIVESLAGVFQETTNAEDSGPPAGA
ncbi:unnamed protein product [Prorocentrum cordatum]|uniref:Uncharacterized protein n=1 Tax=Prorocentrum cordatum TaxID=2364126 RepID=A0ABN9X0D4_9DINO|nr:unnamed protein product [Polarella glacialis]